MEITVTTQLVRLWLSAARFLPQRMLKWRWPEKRTLEAIHAFHFHSAPQFHVRLSWDVPALKYGGFNIINFSPLAMNIVGADFRVSMDSTDLFRISERFPSETPIPPFARSGFQYEHSLSDRQIERLRKYEFDHARIRVEGWLVLKSVHGEIRKEISADVVAVIDREGK